MRGVQNFRRETEKVPVGLVRSFRPPIDRETRGTEPTDQHPSDRKQKRSFLLPAIPTSQFSESDRARLQLYKEEFQKQRSNRPRLEKIKVAFGRFQEASFIVEQ